jgi:hypothetical protein
MEILQKCFLNKTKLSFNDIKILVKSNIKLIYFIKLLHFDLININHLLINAVSYDNLSLTAFALRNNADINTSVHLPNNIILPLTEYASQRCKNKEIIILLVCVEELNSDNNILIYLDNDTLISNENIDPTILIKNHCNNLFSKYLNYDLYSCIRYVNNTAFDLILDQNVFPDYLTISILINKMNKETLLKNEYEKMLVSSINKGYILDNYQKGQLIDNTYVYKIEWKDNVFRQLVELIKGKANIEMAYILPLIIDANILIFPENKEVEDKYIDIFKLNEWVIPDYFFNYVVEQEKNIFTEEEVPENIINIIHNQRGCLKRLGHLREDTIFDDTNIRKLDFNNEIITDEIVSDFIDAAKINGLSQIDLEDFKYKKELLKEYDIIFDLETDIDNEFINFCVISYELIKENLSDAMTFFAHIKHYTI